MLCQRPTPPDVKSLGPVRLYGHTAHDGIAGFGAGGFGQAATGTRAVPYTKTIDQDQSSTSSTTGQKQTVHLNSISAMKQYEGKSPEELRWEDYQVWWRSMP